MPTVQDILKDVRSGGTGAGIVKKQQQQKTTTAPISLAKNQDKRNILSRTVDVLLAPQRATSGLIQKGLERVGLLEKKTPGFGAVAGVQQKLSNTDILRRLGEENKPFSTLGARVVTGQYKPSKSVFSNFVREIPLATAGTLADIVLDPLVVASKLGVVARGTGAIGRGIETTAKSVAESVPAVQRVGKALERIFITRGGQSDAFQLADKTRLIEESLSKPETVRLVAPIIEQPKAIQQRIAQVIKGGITTKPEIQALATPIREELDRVGASVSKLAPELLSEQKFLANKGTYFPRLYTSKEFPTNESFQVESLFPQKPLTGPNARFKPRQDIPADVRKQMGEIQEAGFPAWKALTELRTKEIRLKAFEKYMKSGVPVDEPIKDYIQLPKNPGLGSLAGKFVPPADASEILRLYKIPSPIEEIYGKALAQWKTFKTAYSPATISRNDLTNFFILNPLGGVGPHRIDIYAKTFKELTGKGAFYTRATKQGLEISTQEAAELTARAKELYRSSSTMKKFFPTVQQFNETVRGFYGSQDKFFKLANFIKGVTEDGLSDAQAMSRAQFHLVNYAEVPEFVRWLRKSPIGVPFISFTYGVSKPLAKTLLSRPDKLTAYFKILKGIESLNPTHDTKEKVAQEKAALPDYLRGEAKTVRLPFKDRFGRTQYLDLQYILPFNILESKGVQLFSNPVSALINDISRNKSAFTGNPIWKDGSDTADIRNSIIDYVQKSLLPPLAPGIPTKVGGIQRYGGTSLDKLINSLRQRPTSARPGSKPQALEQTLVEILGGIKTTPISSADVLQTIKNKQYETTDIIGSIRRVMKDARLTKEEKNAEIRRLMNLLKQKK